MCIFIYILCLCTLINYMATTKAVENTIEQLYAAVTHV